MTHLQPTIRKLLFELLSCDHSKTTAHLAEELRVEYPSVYKELIICHQQEYNLSGCGAQMSPITVVNHILAGLSEEGLVERKIISSATLWKKSGSPATDSREGL